MKKRILSLLLATVMVMLAIPAFMLPAAAEAPALPYTTRWTDEGNIPKIDRTNDAEKGEVVAPTGPWAYGRVAVATGVFTEFLENLSSTNEDILGGPSKNLWGGGDGGLFLEPKTLTGTGGYYGGDYLMVVPNTAYNASVRYVAEYTGVATVSVESLYFHDYNLGAVNHRMAIMLNGEVIWPEEATDDTATWFGEGVAYKTDVASQIGDNGSLELNLYEGDIVEFAFAVVHTSARACCFNFEPAVTYTSYESKTGVLEYPSVSPSATATIGYDTENESVTYENNLWKAIAYNAGQEGSNNYVLLNKVKNQRLAQSPSSPDTFNAGYVGYSVNDGGDPSWVPVHYFGIPANSIAGFAYTVPRTGIVDINILSLIQSKGSQALGEQGTCGLVVYLDGKQLWPTDGSWHEIDKETYPIYSEAVEGVRNADDIGALSNVYVEEGSTIKVLLKCVSATNTSFYRNVYHVDANVTYKAVVEAPKDSGTAQIALNEAFAAKFSLDPATVYAGATNVGMYINNNFVAAVDGVSALTGIVAKDIADDITVQPTATYCGVELKGGEFTTSAAELLMQYVDGSESKAEAVAIATLNYAAAAQKYFEPETDAAALANVGLTEEQKNVAYTGEYSAEYSINDAEEKPVDFYGAKPILGDTLKLAVYFTSDADLTEGYTAWIQPYGGMWRVGGEITKVGNNLYKVIFDNFYASVWGYDHTVYLYDNTNEVAVTGNLVYSIGTYAMRMQDNEDVKPVANAMLALFEAAKAYAIA